MRTQWTHIAILAIFSLALSACAIVPEQPNYDQKVLAESQALDHWEQPNKAIATPQISLNALLSTPVLDQLLTMADQNNSDLRQTLLTLKIRKQQLIQAGANTAVQLDASLTAERIKTTGNHVTSAITLSWPADLWRKLDDNTQAANYDLQQQQQLFLQARNTLAAEVMSAWLNLTALQHAINIQTDRIKSLQKNQAYILLRYRSGLGVLEDLDTARGAVSSAQSTLETYQYNLRQQIRDLKVLVGEVNLKPTLAQSTYPSVELPYAELPEQTLSTRPDLQAAYLAIKAAEKRTSVAYKALLPSLSLSASLSQMGTLRESLLTSPTWSLLSQLTAPILNGGQLRASAKQSELATALAYEAYQTTLYNAVNEVEQALDLERSLTLRQQKIQHALDSLNRNVKQYQRRYRLGLVDMLNLLSIQNQTYDLRAQLDNLIYQRLINRIKLGLALGLGANNT